MQKILQYKHIKYTIIAMFLQLIFFILYFYKFLMVKYSISNLLPISTVKLPMYFALFGILAFGFTVLAKEEESTKLKKINFFTRIFILALSAIYIIASLLFTKLISIGIYIALVVLIIYTAVIYFTQRDKYTNYLEEIVEEDMDIKTIDLKPGDCPLGEILKRNVDADGKPYPDQDDFIPSGIKGVLPLQDRFMHLLVLGPTGSGKTSQTLLPAALADFTSDSYNFGDIKVVQTGQIVLEPKGDFAKAVWTFGKIKKNDKRKNYMKFLLDIPDYLEERIASFRADRQKFLVLKNGQDLSKDEEKLLNKNQELISSGKVNSLETEKQIDVHSSVQELLKKRDGGVLSEEQEKELELIEKNLKKLLTIKRELPKYIEFSFDFLNQMTTFALFRYAALLNDMIANPKDLTKEYWQLIIDQDPNEERDVVLLFDPQNKKSPYFNPMFGEEAAVVGNVTSTLTSFMEGSSPFFVNMARTTVQNAIKVAKRVYGNDANLIHINDLLMNNNSRGEEIIRLLDTVDTTMIQANENKDLKTYFLNDYYSGLKGLKNATKTYEHTSGIRSILNNLLDNENVRRVLCPPPGIGTDLNFDEILKTGDKIAISTATGGSDMVNRMLGSFIILQIQTAIFNRTGNENTRTPMILSIDEAHEYLNDSFDSVFSKGRSYVVSAVIATQTLGLFAGGENSKLVSNIKANSRNLIAYPGLSSIDIKFLNEKFGERSETTIDRSISQEVQDDPSKLQDIKSAIGLGGEGGGSGPRETVKDVTKLVSRFTKDQLLFGVNVRTKKINANNGFGTIIYQLVVNKSPQVPTAAKIEYIPYEVKKESDKIIASYDSLLSEFNQSVEKEQEAKSLTEDPLKNESDFNEKSFNSSLNKKVTKESDPKEFARDLEKNQVQDITEEFVTSDDFADITDFDMSTENLDDIDFDEFK